MHRYTCETCGKRRTCNLAQCSGPPCAVPTCATCLRARNTAIFKAERHRLGRAQRTRMAERDTRLLCAHCHTHRVDAPHPPGHPHVVETWCAACRAAAGKRPFPPPPERDKFGLTDVQAHRIAGAAIIAVSESLNDDGPHSRRIWAEQSGADVIADISAAMRDACEPGGLDVTEFDESSPFLPLTPKED